MKFRAGVFVVIVGLAALGCQTNKGAADATANLAPANEAPKPPPPRYPRPEHVRGVYMTAWIAGATKRRAELLQMLADTELNALVIDVRDDGDNYWETGIELSKQAKATKLAVPKPDELMQLLEDEGVYPIARVSCFVDSRLTKHEPARAVQDASGKPWVERNGRLWLDPYNKENWEYLGQVVDFAVKTGFAEIQLDYVRFPGGGKKSSMVFPAKKDWPEGTTESQVIQQFAQFIKDRLPEGVVLSADIFGIVSSNTTKDQGIGQDMDYFPQPFDLLCPMVYPSHYAKGEYGIANPATSPYEIVLVSMRDFKTKLHGKAMRPWLQDFDLGAQYGKDEVRAQVKALKELGIQEYLLWNARNVYTPDAVVDTSDLDPKP
ncbi:MAG: putative glycoside hydrolase [Fimbriimonadaceae bacterium]